MIDTITGLPELSGNQFWRVDRRPVREGYGYSIRFILDLIEPKPVKTVTKRFLRSPMVKEGVEHVAIASAFLDLPAGFLTEDIILKAAKDIMLQRAKSKRARDENSRLLGDYPPKVLSGGKS